MSKLALLVIYITHFFLNVSKGEVTTSGLSVEILDVGQGDAILITTPNKGKILIDGGAGFEVDSYLDKRMSFDGCYLDAVILTHPHRDHLEGLKRVVTRCFVGLIFFNRVDYESDLFEEWLELTEEKEVESLLLGDEFFVDDVYFRVLWPPEDWVLDFRGNVNNSSAVLFMDYKGFEGILTGDAESETLDRLDVSSIEPFVDGGFDFYKVSHHGAKNAVSLRLLEALRPTRCVLSVGQDNQFGHPHDEALSVLGDTCGKTLRTDMDGTVKLIYNQ